MLFPLLGSFNRWVNGLFYKWSFIARFLLFLPMLIFSILAVLVIGIAELVYAPVLVVLLVFGPSHLSSHHFPAKCDPEGK